MADEQMQEAAVEPWFRFIRSRLRSSDICRNVLGALGLGLVAGGSAGGCLGAMAAQLALFLNGTTENQSELTTNITTHSHHPLMAVSYITYLCLLVAISSSAVGVLCGRQAYNLVRRQRGEDISGKALALAAPVVVLGVAVTGAALGAVTEQLVAALGLLSMFEVALRKFLIISAPAILILFTIVLIAKRQFAAVIIMAAFFIYCLPLFDCITYLFYTLTGFVFFFDLESILLLFPPSLLLYQFNYNLSRITKIIPVIINTIVFITISVLHYKDNSVPLLYTNKVAPQEERIFVIILGIQMFQASCGAVLYSYFVTGGAGKGCTGAVTAVAGVLAALLGVLLKVFPMLGTGASLGVLLAVSGGAGVALSAVGDLGQRYGGQVGRVGAIIGAAAGAFLPCYLTQEVKFGIMVALCASAIPGSPYVPFGWEFLYSRAPWLIVMMCICFTIFNSILYCKPLVFVAVLIYIICVCVSFLVLLFCLHAITTSIPFDLI